MDGKQLVREIFEMINSQDYGRVSELVHEDYVDHGSPEGEVHGPEGFLEAIPDDVFSECHREIDLLIVEGDLAAWRTTFTGVHTGELHGPGADRPAGVGRDPQHRPDEGRQGHRALGRAGHRSHHGAAGSRPDCLSKTCRHRPVR